MKRTPLKRKTSLRRKRRRPVPVQLVREFFKPSSVLEQLRASMDGIPLAGRVVPIGKAFEVMRGTKYSRRERDWDRMRWTKLQGCALSRPGAPLPELWRGPADNDRCLGLVEAHHAGEHGLSNKASDDTVIPLCSGHHRALTDRTGIFSGWPRRSLKAWELALVAEYQRAYANYLAWLAAASPTY